MRNKDELLVEIQPLYIEILSYVYEYYSGDVRFNSDWTLLHVHVKTPFDEPFLLPKMEMILC